MKTTNEKQENAKVESKKGAVKAKPDAAQGLRDFFEDGLKDIFWAEHALTKALPKMAKTGISINKPSIRKANTSAKDQAARFSSGFRWDIRDNSPG